MSAVPIQKSKGIELVSTDKESICQVRLTGTGGVSDLSWDRYVRLKACADAVNNLAPQKKHILDVGGFDGALAFFLPEYKVDVIDATTTGGSILETPIEEQSYELVTAIDVLEHIEPAKRSLALAALARAASKFIILNYPCSESKPAQELVFKATGNTLIKEHVEWELPDSNQVLDALKQFGFSGHVKPHTNTAIWVGQYLTQNLAPEKAVALNRYLIDHHSYEPFASPLYHLIVCKK